MILSTVYSGTAADAAGLKAGDILLTFGGEKIFDDRDLTDMIHDRDPGDRVSITLMRDGENMTVDAVLGTRDDMDRPRRSRAPWIVGASPGPCRPLRRG